MSFDLARNCRRFMLFGLLLLVFQSARSQSGAAILDQWLEEQVSDLGGRAVLMIYQNGRIVYSRSVNHMSGRQKMAGKIIARKTGKDKNEILRDFDDQTKINIASCSKWLTAALVMTYIDDGSLRLDDSIGRYLPVMTRNGKGNIRIHDCLSHLTGISSRGIKENTEMIQGGNMDAVIEKIASLPMEGEPGKTFHYSSNGLQIVAAIIEKISGKDFTTAFKERIANPCGMAHTDFGEGPVPLAAGGARSTAADYLRFVSMILQNGMIDGKRILSAASVDKMQHNYTAQAQVVHSPAEAGQWGYGYGAWMMNQGDEKKRSDAVTSPGLFGSFPWVDNQRQYAAVLFTFNLKNKGRHEKYRELKRLVDDWTNTIQTK